MPPPVESPSRFSSFTPPPRGVKGEKKVTGRLVIVVLVIVLTLASGLAGGMGCFFFRMYQSLPTLDQLENIEQPVVSKLIGIDGSVAHEFGTERRYWVSVDSMPINLLNAVVAIEDRKFYRHWGIDLRRIIGAALVDLVLRDYAQGASTITQQLTRNLYLTSRQSIFRKIREMMTAVQIERKYTKREILELYLNQVYLGAGAYGMEAASQRYFGKPVGELTLSECATLAGTIQLPERYRPDLEANLQRAMSRRNTVLRAMARVGTAPRKTVAAICKEPVLANPKEPVAKKAPYFVEVVRKYVAQKYGEDLLYEGGLTIYTTLDPVAQDSAEQAAARHLPKLQKRLNRMCVDSSEIWRTLGIPRDTLVAHFDSLYRLHKKEFAALKDSVRLRAAQVAIVAIDVTTGGVRCLMGGRSFEESKFNRATQAERQPGSAFKPFVYTTAIDSGYTPSTEVLDQAVSLTTPNGDVWRPENYDREFSGPVPLRKALAKSINLVAIQVLLDVGAQAVVDCAHRMGITTELQPVPALAIGSCEVIPMEIINAYGAFANNGVRMEPYLIEKIVDKNGKVLEEHEPRGHEVISPQTAFLMNDMLCGVVQSGTAAAIPGMGFTRPAGGKTGTTNEYSDAWFIGFTPQIVCGVWVGVDERRSLGRGVAGADAAIPIWVPAMKALHRSLPVRYFHRPPGIVTAEVCKKSNLLATSHCPQKRLDYFRAGKLPPECDIHGAGRLRGSAGGVFGVPDSQRGPRAKRRPLMF